ncbi:4-hydroxybenzoate octaprenyltransferase [Chitiniphilus eburneus]|uniref:4-hydroxybenzoate octaprenyltransferase n=1 Tax=Chitiniphilus eburneus TaxID=2571148 RepID=A0A4U0PY12_9NEIS|nr:4-hydroxybenzoate octaprenyltransferase [Chitiniphilus eburneus]TJZ73140.1 4-hydroxybenzoate octaprenyltransferase [Chitiniphilus eburneus]
MNLAAKLDQYLRLTRLNKPIGILLLMWPTLWGLWFAGQGRPEWWVALIFVVGTVLMRSAGCIVNDYADRDYDGHVARTAQRPLATREVSVKEALWLATALVVVSFLLILPLNPLTRWLSVPAVFLAASYPFTKRFFAIPQAYLGIAFGFGIPMSFTALTGEVPLAAWVLLLANVFWSVAYDTAYAMCDREDDLKIGIKTAAITFGRFDVAAILLCHGVFLALMAWVGLAFGRGAFYFAGLLGGAVLVAFDQYPRIRQRDPQRCFSAFLANNRIGGVIFAGLVFDYLFL